MKIAEGTKAKALLANLREGDFSSKEYLGSLETHFNLTEPKVLAFLEEEGRFARLRAEAKRLESRNGGLRPALFGMPVGVKDIFQAKGFATRAGSKLPEKVLQGDEAESVRRLRAAGALVMGKTVTTEFAYFAPGPTMNPHNPAHTPGGSSSGSAAAVAAGLTPLALGTQTIGSVIRPAAFCGVVGFKPSYGRIPTEGVIPLSPSLDHVGSFAMSVWLSKEAASVLLDEWRGDLGEVKRPVLGIPEGDYLERADAETRRRYWQVVEALKKAGYDVRRRRLFPNYDEIAERHARILEAEAARVHADWYRFHSQAYDRRTREMIERGMGISEAELEAAKREAGYFSNTISTIMDIDDIDVWVSPAAPGPAPKGLDSTGDPVMNLPWTQAGLPSLGLPMGKAANGLPLGVQFVADYGKDEELLCWGMELEKVVGE